MAGLEIRKVLISDPVDPSAVDLLKARNIEADLKTNLSKDELLSILRVSS